MSSSKIDAVLSNLRFHLQCNNAKRAPNAIEKALESACSTVDTPERALLESSLLAWVALVSEKDGVKTFNQLSREEAELVIQGANAFVATPTFVANVRAIFESVENGQQRRQYLIDAGLEHLLDIYHNPKKRKCDDMAGFAAVPALKNDQAPSGNVDNVNTAFTETSFLWPVHPDLKLNPKARNLPRVFKQTMCDAIVKVNGLANVSIYYAPTPWQCSMRIEILRNMVSNICDSLFGITIKDEEPGWKIQWEHGAETRLEGEQAQLRFSRCDMDAFRRRVGVPAHDLIAISFQRQNEIENGDELTKLVNLTVWGSKSSNDMLELTADAVELETVRISLWGLSSDA